MIAVMLSVCVCLFVVFFFLAVNMHLSACWECFFVFFFCFFFSFQVCLGFILLNHLTPSTKGKVIPKAPKVQ